VIYYKKHFSNHTSVNNFNIKFYHRKIILWQLQFRRQKWKRRTFNSSNFWSD